jgi:hypothetical protein
MTFEVRSRQVVAHHRLDPAIARRAQPSPEGARLVIVVEHKRVTAGCVAAIARRHFIASCAAAVHRSRRAIALVWRRHVSTPAGSTLVVLETIERSRGRRSAGPPPDAMMLAATVPATDTLDASAGGNRALGDVVIVAGTAVEISRQAGGSRRIAGDLFGHAVGVSDRRFDRQGGAYMPASAPGIFFFDFFFFDLFTFRFILFS